MISDAMQELLELARNLASAADPKRAMAEAGREATVFDVSYEPPCTDEYDCHYGEDYGPPESQAVERDLFLAAAERLTKRFGLHVASHTDDDGLGWHVAIGVSAADAKQRLLAQFEHDLQWAQHRVAEAEFEAGGLSADDAFAALPPRTLARYRAEILDQLPSPDVAKGPTCVGVGEAMQIQPYIAERILKQLKTEGLARFDGGKVKPVSGWKRTAGPNPTPG